MTNPTYTFDADTLSDLHKDACGFRPRSEEFWAAWDAADNDGKQRIWDDLLGIANREVEAEREEQRMAIAKFEERVLFKQKFGESREDVIRGLHEQYDTQGSDEWLEYELGIPYGYLSGRQPGMLA